MSTKHGMGRAVRWCICIVSAASFLTMSTGVNCDSSSNNEFRDTAAAAIGSGLITIFSGLVNGTVAAITAAGDDSSSNSNTTN